MKFALHTFLTGTPHQVRNLIMPQGNMLRISIYLIAEEETDVFLIGVFRAEFLSLILNLSRLTGHYLPTGEDLNTKESRSGGWGKPSKAWTYSQTKSFGGRNKPSLTVLVQKKNLGSRSFKKKQTFRSLLNNSKNPLPHILTTHQRPNKHCILERSSLKFMGMSVKKSFRIIGSQNGIGRVP